MPNSSQVGAIDTTARARALAAALEAPTLSVAIRQGLLDRNSHCEEFFEREATRIALTSRAMAERFSQGGRLLAFGQGAYATDAQHVSVEFVHPVIVGKRALPALDLSVAFRPWLETLAQPEDIVMGFGPSGGDHEIDLALESAASRGAMTVPIPGRQGAFAFAPPTDHPLIHQEMVEILYHTMWETVHVFLEHRGLGQEVGEASFLYPFLDRETESTAEVVEEVANSIRMKVADDAELRVNVAVAACKEIGSAIQAMREELKLGGKLIVFGNGGSATDANDFALDCVLPPPGSRPIPAISLALEPANLTAIANDIGTEAIFLRQLIAQARPHDVAIAISTSGGSKNIIATLEEARKRQMLTVALLGCDGGEILRRDLADFPLVVHSSYIPRIQEVQASIYHIIRENLEAATHA